jgi:hypothetical protein
LPVYGNVGKGDSSFGCFSHRSREAIR